MCRHPAGFAMMGHYLRFLCFNFNAFQAFLRDERSEENAIFWQKCDQYQKSTDAAYRKQLARLIYADHVAESSAEQVNIDADVRQTVERRLSTAPVNLFDDAQRQVYLLMKYDPYPRFLRSRVYVEAVNAERQHNRLELPATDRQAGGGLLSRLRQKWKAVKASRLTTKDDSGYRTSLSSLGSDTGDAEHSQRSGSSFDAAVTPTSLLNRLLRRLSSSKSTHRDGNDSPSTTAALSSAPAARRSLFFERWRRADATDEDAKSVTTVVSAQTTPGDTPRRRYRGSSDGRRRLSGPPSHLVRCDADERRRFAAVMARLAVAGEDSRLPTSATSNVDGHRRHVIGERPAVDSGQRSDVTDQVRRHHRYLRRVRRKSTDSAVEFTVYFV